MPHIVATAAVDGTVGEGGEEGWPPSQREKGLFDLIHKHNKSHSTHSPGTLPAHFDLAVVEGGVENVHKWITKACQLC